MRDLLSMLIVPDLLAGEAREIGCRMFRRTDWCVRFLSSRRMAVEMLCWPGSCERCLGLGWCWPWPPQFAAAVCLAGLASLHRAT